MINISSLIEFVSAGNILWTEHVALRLRERGLKRSDIIHCIQNGEIIEQYPSDTPFPSCLLLGRSLNGKPMHIVCSLNPSYGCCIITAYIPSEDRWEADFKKRRGGM